MKKECKCAFQSAMAIRFKDARSEAKMTQAKFSELLLIDERTYIRLEHGANCCCALTLLLYLVFVCKDVQGFVDEMRSIILNVYEREEFRENDVTS